MLVLSWGQLPARLLGTPALPLDEVGHAAPCHGRGLGDVVLDALHHPWVIEGNRWLSHKAQLQTPNTLGPPRGLDPTATHPPSPMPDRTQWLHLCLPHAQPMPHSLPHACPVPSQAGPHLT